LEILKYILTIIIAYLLGSISISVIISTVFFKKDIRTLGSNNAGSTNMARVFSLGAGIITLAGDVLKTIVAILIGQRLIGQEIGLILAGIFCLIGHSRPIFFNFKGGKGVAVSAGIALMLDWHVLLVTLVVFAITAAASQIVSLSSILAIASFPIANTIMHGFYWPEFALALFVLAASLYLHRENIRRLFAKTEPKFTAAHPRRDQSGSAG